MGEEFSASLHVDAVAREQESPSRIAAGCDDVVVDGVLARGCYTTHNLVVTTRQVLWCCRATKERWLVGLKSGYV